MLFFPIYSQIVVKIDSDVTNVSRSACIRYICVHTHHIHTHKQARIIETVEILNKKEQKLTYYKQKKLSFKKMLMKGYFTLKKCLKKRIT